MSRLRSPSSGARVDLVTDPDPSASSIPSHITPGQVEGFALVERGQRAASRLAIAGPLAPRRSAGLRRSRASRRRDVLWQADLREPPASPDARHRHCVVTHPNADPMPMTQSKEVDLGGAKSHAVETIDTGGSVIDEALGWSVLSFDVDVDHWSRS